MKLKGKWYYFKNWWHYHKWYVIVGAVLLLIIIQLIGSYFHLWEKKPDLQIAYVGSFELPSDTADSIEEQFARLAGDYNGDGQVIVQLNQYVTDNSSMSTFGADVPLIGDIEDCDSYFFLLEDPDSFQLAYHLLADPDGGCPDEADFSTDNKTIRWSDCPALNENDPGSYTDTLLGQEITGSNEDLISGLYLGRRCFYNDETTPNAAQCSELWDTLTENEGDE